MRTKCKRNPREVALKYLLPSTILLLVAFSLRFYVGSLFKIAALMIEGLHMLIDFIMTVMVVIALLVIYSQYAKRFPYGLFKIEDLIALILSILTLYSAFVMIIEGLEPSKSIVLNAEPLAAQALTIPLILLSMYLKRVASSILRSPSLRADVTHTSIDVVESLAVLVGLFLYYVTSMMWIYYLTLAIAGLGLIATSIEVGKSSLFALLDLPKNKEIINKIKLDVERLKEDVKVIDIKARWAGSVMFLELTIRLHPLITIEDSYGIVREIIEHILFKYEEVEDVIVRVEPTRRRDFILALPQDEPNLSKPLSRHFGRAKYFTVVKIESEELVSVEYITNPYVKAERKNVISKFLIGANIAEMLHKRGITDVITLNIGEIAFSILLRHGILIWSGKNEKSADDLIKSFINGRLARLKRPTREEAWKKSEFRIGD